MSSFLENKQNLIIIGQFIIIAGVSFYFHKRIKLVVHNINELHKMVLTQSEQINKQAQIIDRLAFQLNNLQQPYQHFQTFDQPELKSAPVVQKKKKEKINTIEKEEIPTNNKSENFEKIFNSTLIFKSFGNLEEKKEGPSIEVVEEISDPSLEPRVIIPDISSLRSSPAEKKFEKEITEDDLDAELEEELKELED